MNYWTKEEKDRLRELLGTMSHAQIAKEIGRSRGSVEQMTRHLGLIQEPRGPSHTIDTPRPGVRIITHRMGG